MAFITKEIKEFVNKQKLGFVATVCPDGTPNLSPFHSPGTINNLLTNDSYIQARYKQH